MKFNSERLETVIAGFLFVSIGTMIAASRVGAESNHPMSSQTKSSTPATGVATNTATPAATVAPAACAPIETPDAMCTVPLKKGPETKFVSGITTRVVLK